MNPEKCVEEEAGTPTLTIELPTEARMIPWSAFVSASLTSERIELSFTEWLVVVEGELLDELWSTLQLQDVRVLRALDATSPDECHITSLHLSQIEGED